MSFQAKNLRVQLQSGESVVFEEAVPAPGEEPERAADEKIIKPVCVDDASFYVASCLDFFTTALLVKSASIALLDAEQLPILRERLEARLKEIDAAEKALKPGSTQ